MNPEEYNSTIRNSRCPYCGLKLGNFVRSETKSVFKNCSRCSRIWEMVGGYENGFPCEEVNENKNKKRFTEEAAKWLMDKNKKIGV